MSSIYIQEPPTQGKVLLTTSMGDIDIELWSKEAPKACRNFVQLCMEGYYTGTIFHRVVKDFIAQGGDPTGTGEGGESIYGKPFRDEIHTRLRFVRRGLVAMANAGKDDNASQFFFTLGPTQELQGKHTVFGKVTGETIYNLMNMNDIPTDESDRPLEPPKIKKTEVLMNPFDDIIPRETIKHEKKEPKKKKSQSKAKKDFKLLSFGEEAEEDEEETNQVVETMRSKGKSAHDLADDPRLSHVAGDLDVSATAPKASEEDLELVKQKLQQHNADKEKSADSDSRKDNSSASRVDEMRRESRRLKRELQGPKSEDDDPEEEVNKKSEPESVTEFKKEKEHYLQQKKALPKKGANRENQTLAILEKFRSKLNTVQALDAQYGDDDKEVTSAKAANKDDGEIQSGAEEEEEETDEGWMTHKLEFGDAHSKVFDANVTDVDRYKIFDPRNPMTKRRNEEAENDGKRQKRERNKVL